MCPTRAPVELDERIVDELVTAHAKATFFVSGRWAKAKPDVVRHLAAEPLFEIGNHTFRHPHLIRADDAHVREELASTQELLRSLTGRTPTTWRPPFGEVDDRIAGIAAGIGLVTIEYDVISGDPIPTATATSLVHAVLLHAKAGSIIVMHANHRRFPTAAAVPQIIAGLRAAWGARDGGELVRQVGAGRRSARRTGAGRGGTGNPLGSPPMERTFVALGAAMAGLAVAAGAFGAHGLRSRLDADMLAVFETAARYQMYHGLALLAVAWAVGRWPAAATAGWLFVAGIVLFSGSLYVLSLSGVRWLGAITPLGGLCFLAGWAVLAWSAARG